MLWKDMGGCKQLDLKDRVQFLNYLNRRGVIIFQWTYAFPVTGVEVDQFGQESVLTIKRLNDQIGQ